MGPKSGIYSSSSLGPLNQRWVKNAGALILVLSSTTYERNGKAAVTHSFDTGLAVSHMLLQASNRGIPVHPMEVFDYDKARKDLVIKKGSTREAIIAVGEEAPEGRGSQKLAERDKRVSNRKNISEFAFEGHLPSTIKAHVKKKEASPSRARGARQNT